MIPLFAFFSDLENRFTQLIEGLLLVAGGFLVGYLLGGLVGWALGKWVFRMRDRSTPKQLGQPIGGVLLAIIVALIVFTGGRGKGPGGNGDKTGTSDTVANQNAQPKADPDPKTQPILPKPPDVKPADVTIRVTVYGGGAVTGERFYQLEDDKTLKTLDELKQAITTRQAAEKGKITVAILFPGDKNVALPQEHPMVTRLAKWAREEAGLDVTFPANR
jgi:hypothetical protein